MNDDAPRDPTVLLARTIAKAILDDPAADRLAISATAQGLLAASSGVRERFGTLLANAMLNGSVGEPAPGQTKHSRLRPQDVFKK